MIVLIESGVLEVALVKALPLASTTLSVPGPYSFSVQWAPSGSVPLTCAVGGPVTLATGNACGSPTGAAAPPGPPPVAEAERSVMALGSASTWIRHPFSAWSGPQWSVVSTASRPVFPDD